VQPERGGLLVKRPSARVLAARPRLVLTPRDLAILDAVNVHGFLTVDLIERAFFPPPPGGRRSPCSRAYERVRQLWLWGYLVRVEQPMARSLGGQRPYLYMLGRPALSHVEARQKANGATARLRRVERLDPRSAEHDLQAAALWANLRAVIRSSHMRAIRWIPERWLRGRNLRIRDPQNHHVWLPFLPDGYCELTYPNGGVRCLLVETDTGSLSLDRFARKVRAWEAFLLGGRFKQAFVWDSFDVVVLAASFARLKHLWAIADGHLADWSPRRGAYYFATWDVLSPSRFGGKHWLTLEQKWVPLLDAAAFTPPIVPLLPHPLTYGHVEDDEDVVLDLADYQKEDELDADEHLHV
jgi:hypothetical protein